MCNVEVMNFKAYFLSYIEHIKSAFLMVMGACLSGLLSLYILSQVLLSIYQLLSILAHYMPHLMNCIVLFNTDSQGVLLSTRLGCSLMPQFLLWLVYMLDLSTFYLCELVLS